MLEHNGSFSVCCSARREIVGQLSPIVLLALDLVYFNMYAKYYEEVSIVENLSLSLVILCELINIDWTYVVYDQSYRLAIVAATNTSVERRLLASDQ